MLDYFLHFPSFSKRIETLPEAQRTQKLTPWLGLNLATTWHHLHYLHIWPPYSATCINYKFVHQMAPLALLQIWPPDGATCILHFFQSWPTGRVTCIATLPWIALLALSVCTCIGSKFGHQLAPLALLPKLATRLCYLYCYIALDCPIDIISLYWVGILISQSHIS